MYAQCLHDGARQTIEIASRPREEWVSQATWELVQAKKLAFMRVKQNEDPAAVVGLKEQYRHASDACRKSRQICQS